MIMGIPGVPWTPPSRMNAPHPLVINVYILAHPQLWLNWIKAANPPPPPPPPPLVELAESGQRILLGLITAKIHTTDLSITEGGGPGVMQCYRL